MHEGGWVGLRQRGRNDDLLAVYKARGKNGHLGARYLQKSLVTFLWFQSHECRRQIYPHRHSPRPDPTVAQVPMQAVGAWRISLLVRVGEVSASWQRRTGTLLGAQTVENPPGEPVQATVALLVFRQRPCVSTGFGVQTSMGSRRNRDPIRLAFRSRSLGLRQPVGSARLPSRGRDRQAAGGR